MQQKKGGEMLFLFGPFHSFLFFLLPHPPLPTASWDHVTLKATNSGTTASNTHALTHVLTHTHTHILVVFFTLCRHTCTVTEKLLAVLKHPHFAEVQGVAAHQSTRDLFHIVLHRCNNLTELLGTGRSFCIAHFQATVL